jgi:glycosyltransferase involved in cell wall biosynthesis
MMRDRPFYKILYVQPYKGNCGPHQSLKTLVSKLDRTRFDPTVLLPGDEVVAHEFAQLNATLLFDAGVQTVPRSFSPLRQLEFASVLWKVVRRLVRIIQRDRIDLVHINSEACWSGAIAAKMAHVPAIIHLHGLSALSPPWVGRVTVGVLNRHSQAMIACSNEVKRAYLRSGANPALMHVIHNGINIDMFTPDNIEPTLRKELKISNGQPLIGMIANFDRRKGHHDFVISCADVISQVPDAQFVIVGDTKLDHKYYEQIQHLITTHGLASAVHLLGVRKDIPNVLRSLDIVVQPSLTEAGPIVPLEAMAMQRPLIVTDVGGNSEEVVNGQTGIVVPVADGHRLATAIMKLLSDIPLGQELGRRGRQRVLEKYTDDIHVSQVEQLYDGLLIASNWHVR